MELSHLPIKAGLYRDDLLSVSSLSAREVEKTSQKMRDIFRSHGLGLKIEANLKVTEFLDVLLDLKSGTHRAWVKPEQVIHYVHRESNHPAHVLKNIPLEVQRRLSSGLATTIYSPTAQATVHQLQGGGGGVAVFCGSTHHSAKVSRPTLAANFSNSSTAAFHLDTPSTKSSTGTPASCPTGQCPILARLWPATTARWPPPSPTWRRRTAIAEAETASA